MQEQYNLLDLASVLHVELSYVWSKDHVILEIFY